MSIMINIRFCNTCEHDMLLLSKIQGWKEKGDRMFFSEILEKARESYMTPLHEMVYESLNELQISFKRVKPLPDI